VDDREFLERFEALTLSFDRWTHRAHVKVAYLYAMRYPLAESIDRMRAGIKAYNAHNRVLPEAQARFVEPDLAPLPRILSERP
jgi:hypothetical protein